MASLASNDAILKELRDCVNTGNEDRCRQISPYFHSYWKDLNVKNGFVCVDDQTAISNSINDAYVEAINATRQVVCGMTDKPVHVLWLFMHRDLLSKKARCNPCVKIGNKLKSTIPSSKWAPLKYIK